jgi:signal transduction histidine kinase
MTGASSGEIDLLRRRVLNVVGHELRTPVSTVRGLADELEQRAGGDEVVEALARNARRLDQLVHDLLLAAAIGTAVPVGEPEAVDLVQAVRDAWTRAGREPGDLAVEGEATAMARTAVVSKALDVLVDNAVTHGEPPFAARLHSADGTAVIELSNGGEELGAEDLALAVEAFYRSERGVTNAPGLGLGLAIAHTLATADGGALSLGPADGGGVVARLELPSA